MHATSATTSEQKKRRRRFTELDFVQVGAVGLSKVFEAEKQNDVDRPWNWCWCTKAYSPLRYLHALVPADGIASTARPKSQIVCSHDDCEYVGRIKPCTCSKGAAQSLCALHAAEHYATFVRQGSSECGCFSSDVTVPRGIYTLVAETNDLCAAADKERAVDDMQRVLQHFRTCVADVNFELTPKEFRSPHALDLAIALAERVSKRIEQTATRSKIPASQWKTPKVRKMKTPTAKKRSRPKKARKRLFASVESEQSEEQSDITVQKTEWPAQPPPLII